MPGYPLSNAELQALNELAASVGSGVSYYLDGTAGSDLNDGSSWAKAWKTWGKLQAELAHVGNWRESTYVFVRGNFGGIVLDLYLRAPPGCGLYMGVPLTEYTVAQTGNVTTVVTPTRKHGRKSLILGGGITVTAADLHRVVELSIGADKATYQVIRADPATNEVWLPEGSLPAWLVGGGTVTARLLDGPAAMGITSASINVHGSSLPYNSSWSKWYSGFLFGLVVDSLVHYIDCTRLGLAMRCNGGTTAVLSEGCDTMSAVALTSSYGFSPAALAAFGLCAGAAPRCDHGLCLPSGSTWSWNSALTVHGYVGGTIAAQAGASVTASGVNVGNVHADNNGLVTTVGVICRAASSSIGGFNAECGRIFVPGGVSFMDLPSTGRPTHGLLRALREGVIGYDLSQVDGDNTGTGVALYGIVILTDGHVYSTSSISADLKGKHGKVYMQEGTLDTAGMSIGASEGAGVADIIMEPGSVFRPSGNVVKSATNPSGGGTAKPVLYAKGAIGALQVSGNFTLPAGSGSYTNDYGAEGPIVLDACPAVIGTLTGGTGVTTGIGCTLRYGATIRHKGGGLSGAAPLQLGGLPAPVPWPASVLTDLGAVNPQLCMVVPNAT